MSCPTIAHTTWLQVIALSITTMVTTASAQHILGTYPIGGGPISLTVSGKDAKAAGLDFVSRNGDLIPVAGGNSDPFALSADADSFTFLLANIPTQITYGNLGTRTTFEDGTTTQLSAAVAANNDVVAAWGRGANPVEIPFAAVDLSDGGTLVGSYSNQGGPVSVTALGSDFSIVGFDFQSASGALVPFGVGAAPFDLLLSNTPNQITLEADAGMSLFLPENTTITLPVGLAADATDVLGFYGDSSTPTPLQLVSSGYPKVTADTTLPPIIERNDLPAIAPPAVEPPRVQPPIEPPVVSPPVVSPPVLDNDDNLLGGGGNGMQPTDPPVTDLPGGGGSQNPSAVPEPSSLMVWMTLGLVAAFQRWRTAMTVRKYLV